MYDVSVVPCADYGAPAVDAAMKALLTPLNGLSWVHPGMKVLLKPNLVSARKPDSAVATHPEIICALTRLLIARGAEVWIADSPGGPFTPALLERAYRVTGMKEAEKFGAHLNYNTSASLRHAPGARVARQLTICDYLDGMDAVINVCKLKTHGMMGLSAAAKNLFGIVPGTVKPECHFRYPDPMDFARMIVDLEEYVRPVLHICDAIEGMEGNGPTAGTPRHIGVMLAARSALPLDMVCAEIIGCGPVPTIRAAQETRPCRNGIEEKTPDLQGESAIGQGERASADANKIKADRGTRDLPGTAKEDGEPPKAMRDIRIFGQYPTIADWKIVRNFHSTVFRSGGRGPVAWAQNRILPRLLTARPGVQRGECVGCGKCAQICPAKAICMVSGSGKGNSPALPEINRGACIRCFCCQEFCPKGAMKVRRPLVARILQGVK